MFEKKTVYQSELVAAGKISVLIQSEPAKSKYPGKGNGFYINFKYKDKEHQYIIENDSIQKKLAGLKGHVVEIEASGTREEADVHVFDAAGPGSRESNQARAQQPPPREGAPPSSSDPVKAAKVMLLQHVNARVLSFEAADETDRRWRERGHAGGLTEEQWASAANCYYISLDRAGLIAMLPWKEIPPHAPKEPERKPEPPPPPPPRRPEPPAADEPDDDEIPF